MLFRIDILRKTDYKGCPVYILHFLNCFQYLFIFEGEVYQSHIFFKYNWLYYILYLLKFRDSRYTKEQLVDGEQMILNNALASIDANQQSEARKEDRKTRRQRERKLAKEMNKPK